VPLVDVLRAAVSEIEHYQRVVVQAPPQATIVGRSTSDIVHLLAELLDNATSFSPPDSQVIISSHRTADGSILVEIADRGVGMPDQEIADANRRLSTPSAVDVSTSRRMGLYVVGRLGTRHGITVHLGGASMGGPGGGLTASVTLPAHLVVTAGEGGARAPRPDGALAPAAANGVPPQRAGHLGRPTSRAALAAPGNGQGYAQASGLNGLPTRTPGSSLRPHTPMPVAEAEPASTEQPTSAPDRPAEQANPFAVPAPPAARAGEGNEEPPEPRDAGAPEPDDRDADSLPTGAVFTVGTSAAAASAERAGEPVDDGTAETPPSGQRGDRQGVRGGWGLPARATGAATPEADADGVPDGSDRAAAGTATAGSGTTAADAALPQRKPRPTPAERGRPEAEPVESPAAAAADGAPAEADDIAAERAEAAASARDDDTAAETGQSATDGTADADDDAVPGGRSASPRPRPTPGPGPNGTYHDLAVPATPYEAFDDGSGLNGTGNGPGPNGTTQYGVDRNGELTPPGTSPHTTPLPVMPGSAPAGAYGPDDGADALFSASVPAMAEPDGLSRSRRPLAELRQGPADMTETTPIFEEIASAWFASHRPVPVDWELGRRPGAELEAEPEAPAAPPAPAPSASPAPQAPAPEELDQPTGPARVTPPPSPVAASAPPVAGPPAQAFATAADEGWRAASGAATERPDELTAAGLPKRRPRARLVPGSAGSAVLAAPASPTRSAESVRGRLASYQQGVRQGREIRLRRDPDGAESGPVEENAAAPAGGGEHDEENR